MSDRIPDHGPAESGSRLWISLDAKKGRFYWTPRGLAKQFSEEVIGVLERIELEYDEEGNPGKDVAPGWVLKLQMDVKDLGASEVHLRAKVAMRHTIRKLLGPRKGADVVISLTCQAFERGTFLDVHYWDGAQWSFDHTKECPMLEGSTADEQTGHALRLIVDHPAFDQARRAPVMAHPRFPRLTVTQPGPPHGGRDFHKPATAAQAPGGRAAFGVPFLRFAPDEWFEQSTPEKLFGAAEEAFEKHGLGWDDFDHIQTAVLFELGMARRDAQTRGARAVTLAFLQGAGDSQIQEALDWREPVVAPAGEFDPFADD